MKNKLKLNPDKVEVLLAGSSLGPCTLKLDGVSLPLKASVHTLRVLLDPLFEQQAAAVTKNAEYQLQLVHQHCPFQD